jgi:hypothetical protein
MKKIATLLIALIATASMSFAASGNDFEIIPAAQSMQLEEFLDNYGTTYQIQAAQDATQGVVDFKAISLEDAVKTKGLMAVYSVDNTLIDTTALDRSTNLEGLLAQVEQAEQIATNSNIADAGTSTNASHI